MAMLSIRFLREIHALLLVGFAGEVNFTRFLAEHCTTAIWCAGPGKSRTGGGAESTSEECTSESSLGDTQRLLGATP
jgi:hypothetical protein